MESKIVGGDGQSQATAYRVEGGASPEVIELEHCVMNAMYGHGEGDWTKHLARVVWNGSRRYDRIEIDTRCAGRVVLWFDITEPLASKRDSWKGLPWAVVGPNHWVFEHPEFAFVLHERPELETDRWLVEVIWSDGRAGYSSTHRDPGSAEEAAVRYVGRERGLGAEGSAKN